MNNMTSSLAYLIGRHTRSEFGLPKQDIELVLAKNHWNSIQRSDCRFVPETADLFIFFQSYPDEFGESFLYTIKKHFPLAPVIIILGTCVEGEMRTGYPLIGGLRLYWHQWNDYYKIEFNRFFQRRSSILSLPPTSNDDEINLFHIQKSSDKKMQPLTQHEKKQCLIIFHEGPFGNDSVMNQLLADMHQEKNYSLHFDRDDINNSFSGTVLADVDDSPFPKILKAVQRLRHDYADAKIKLYINSPRINEKTELQKIGADEILSKPVLW